MEEPERKKPGPKKAVKVGDTFVDGGLTYKILKINEDGTYISTRVE